MSLSPDDYRRSIGIAKCGYGSCLVYLGSLMGVSPCGCDGWPLIERDGMIYSNFSDTPPQVFPPWYYCGAPGKVEMDFRTTLSRELADDVNRIRSEYLAAH